MNDRESADGAGGGKSSKGESHRIYWQQWPAAAIASGIKPSRRDIITGSAAIRISPDGARAQDVTKLLCETLNLHQTDAANTSTSSTASLYQESWDKVQDAWEQDCLVLVGTLYSLPLHYVRFEYEQQQQFHRDPPMKPDAPGPVPTSKEESGTSAEEAAVLSASSSIMSATARPLISKNDPPFHVIKSLTAADNPIDVRNAMIVHLKHILSQSTAAALASAAPTKPSNTIAPKLQWYFVPGKNHKSSPIPSFIDLDGYTTDMEDEAEDDDFGSTTNDGYNNNSLKDICYNEAEHDFDPDELIRRLPLSLQEQCHNIASTSNHKLDESMTSTGSTLTVKDKIIKRERQRLSELSLFQSSHRLDSVSGFLLKQSMVDPFVWKRVHCVLADDHLWYVSRIYTRDETNETFSSADKNDGNKDIAPIYTGDTTTKSKFYSYAKHRSLELTRALLIQPSKENPAAPLFRTPFAFELVDSNGVTHRFRASNADVHKRWVSALNSRIVQSYENSLFDYAQLIVRDETEARNKRYLALAVEPFWEKQAGSKEELLASGSEASYRHMSVDSHTMTVLRFGMEVMEFRERCRHIQAIFPAQHPVFAMSRLTTEIVRNNGGTENGSKAELPSIPTEGSIHLDLKTQALIKSAWDDAIRLGSRATKVSVKLQGITLCDTSGRSSPHMPRSLETICQHLEYVITGSYRGDGSVSRGRNRSENTRQFPPPIDMFDNLLAELQTIAAVSSAKRCIGNSCSSKPLLDSKK